MPHSTNHRSHSNKLSRSREDNSTSTSSSDIEGGSQSLGTLALSNPNHTPPLLFPSVLNNSFKRARTTSPPTSTDGNGSETDAEGITISNIATPSSESDIVSSEKREGSPFSANLNFGFPTQSTGSTFGHSQHQHTPLRFSFGSASISEGGQMGNIDRIDGLITKNMLNITDADGSSSGSGALPSYQQAIGQTIEISTPPVDVDMASSVMPSMNKPDYSEQLAKVTESNKQALQLNQSWFLVDRKWFRLWSTACSDERKSKEDGDLAVGVVQTKDLLEDQQGIISMKVGIQEGVDFELLSRDSWELLVGWYGRSDPPIERKVIKMPSSDTLRIELYPPVLRITCIGEQSTSFTAKLSVLETLGDLKKVAINHLKAPPGSLSFRFWRLPLDQMGSPLTNKSLQVAGVELIAEDKEDITTLAELQLDQPVESLALEVKKSESSWSFNKDGKPVSSVKGIFKQDGGDFLSRMQSGTTSDLASTSAATSTSSSSNSAALRVTRSQTAADRGAEKQSGLTGLYNLGNTCFMNAALQCMSNTKELKDYFVSGVYKSEVNADNPLGMGGAMAKVFGELLVKLWKTGGGAWHPREFKTVLSRFSPQFIGYAQQDTQELLAFLLDGLHEDLNRIVKKPYIEAPDWEGGGLKEMVAFAHKQWEIYKLRNDSVIVDLFQGQYRSTLVCPDCGKVSIKFDPFMYLTLPIPNRKIHIRKVIYLPWDPSKDPIEVEMQFTGETSIAKLKKNLAEWFDSDPNRMIACDVFSKTFYRVYGDFETATEIGNNDVTFIYELPSQLKPIAPVHRNSSSYHRRETIKDMEAVEGLAKGVEMGEEVAILPVFSLAKGMRHNSNYYNRGGGAAFGQPFFIAVPKEKIDDEEAIQRILMDKYMQYTADKKALREYWEEVEGEEEGSQEDWDMLNDTPSSVVLAENGESIQDTVAEIHEGGEVVHIVPDQSQLQITPGEVANDEMDSTKKKSKKKAFTLHFVVNREEQSPVTLKPDAYEEYGEELQQRISRLKAEGNLKGYNSHMETDQRESDDLIHVEKETSGLIKSKWPVIYTGGALVCSWSDEVKDRVFGQQDDDWGGGSNRSCFVDPQLESDRSADSSEKKAKATITIDDCLNEFTKEEQLGESDPWYCPQCKDFKQATKKFDLWKVPDILVVHLKRFSSGRISRDKIDSFIDFPIHNLDLTNRVEGAKAVSQLHNEEEDDEKLMQSIGSLGADDDAVEADQPIYDLYAVDNHYGGLGGGHYTAFAKNPEDEKWYYFDDSSVRSVGDSEEVKGKAAYLLFYRRRTTRPIGGKSRDKVREKFKSNEDNDTHNNISKQDDMNEGEAGARGEEEEEEEEIVHQVESPSDDQHHRMLFDQGVRLVDDDEEEESESTMIGRYPWGPIDDEMISPPALYNDSTLDHSKGWGDFQMTRRNSTISSNGSISASLGDVVEDDSSFEVDTPNRGGEEGEEGEGGKGERFMISSASSLDQVMLNSGSNSSSSSNSNSSSTDSGNATGHGGGDNWGDANRTHRAIDPL